MHKKSPLIAKLVRYKRYLSESLTTSILFCFKKVTIWASLQIADWTQLVLLDKSISTTFACGGSIRKI